MSDAAGSLSHSDSEMKRMFDDMRNSIRVLQADTEALQALHADIQADPVVYDTEDLEVVAATLELQQKQLLALVQEFEGIQMMYQQQVIELEKLIKRKEDSLRLIDSKSGVISSHPILTDHFGKKQGQLVRDLQEFKRQLCIRTRLAVEGVTASESLTLR
jgi:hypothetical protein